MSYLRILLFVTMFLLEGVRCLVRWENMQCSSDAEQSMPEGKVSNIARFPWFGVLQHTFYLGGKTRFAVTSGVLIHPSFVIAPAEDIARIQPGLLINNTKFIVWKSEAEKYSIDIESYYLPPEYTEGITLASLALLQIRTDFGEGSKAPVPLVCLPIKGAGAFIDLYTVKMTDESGEVNKEVYKMDFVDSHDCDEFYYTHKLHHKLMSPVNSICAVASNHTEPCVWDAGAALITRQSWGYWKLLGFSVRGPGCGAPTRFLYIHDYLLWIDEIIARKPLELREEDETVIFRRVSPVKLIMYKAKIRQPRDIGQCDRGIRGNVLYKDNSEILVSKNFAQGFFFVSMAQVAELNCAVIMMDVNSRTNAAVWVEHHCHKDLMGDRRGKDMKGLEPNECFLYFKTVAFIEFRFYFSFKAMLEITMYGTEDPNRYVPNPFPKLEHTYDWIPTYSQFRTGWFMPYYSWWWAM